MTPARRTAARWSIAACYAILAAVLHLLGGTSEADLAALFSLAGPAILAIFVLGWVDDADRRDW